MNLETLYLEIQDEITERKNQLQKISPDGLAYKYKFEQEDENFFFLHSIPVIYAIWEGYAVKVLELYLEYLNTLEIKTKEIHNNILIFCLEYNLDFKIQNYPDDKNRKAKYTENLKKWIGSETIKLPIIIDTKDNLGFDITNYLLEMFCLKKFDEFEKNTEKVPDDIRKEFFSDISDTKIYPLRGELSGGSLSLLKMRNEIVHKGIYGGVITDRHIRRFIFLVDFLMEQLFEKIKIGIEKKTYLKSE